MFRVRVANVPQAERRLEGRAQLPAKHRHARRLRPLAPHAPQTHHQELPAPAGPDDCSQVQSCHSDPTVAYLDRLSNRRPLGRSVHSPRVIAMTRRPTGGLLNAPVEGLIALSAARSAIPGAPPASRPLLDTTAH